MPLSLAFTLAALRLIGGLLRLEVGYKVGGQIVVLGWLAHATQLAEWVPSRLVWTAFGVIISLISLRLFWPSRGLDQVLSSYRRLLGDLQETLHRLAERVAVADGALPPDRPGPTISLDDYRRLHRQLQALRKQRPALAQELGNNPDRHPANRLMACYDDTASQLVTSIAGLLRHPPPQGLSPLVRRLNGAESDMLTLLAQRLALWQELLAAPRRMHHLPPPPDQPLELPETWRRLNDELNDPIANAASLERLERIAIRLMLCRQAERALRDGEANWRRIASSG